MVSSQTHKRIYSKRRQRRDWDFGYPLHKRLIRRFEHVNKFLWTGLLGKLLGVRNVSAPLNPISVQSILFIRNDAIGDMVVTSPIWHVIRKEFPHIRIGVVASSRNRMVLDHDPAVDRLFNASEGRLKDFWRVKKEIAKESWDLVMPMNYSRKTPIAILAHFLAPKSIASTLVRPGESMKARSQLFGIVVPSPYRTEEIEMIEQIRIHLKGVLDMQITEEDWKPMVFPDPEAIRAVNERISNVLQRDGSFYYIHINLEARTAFREYGLPLSSELSRRLAETYPDASILLTSSPAACMASESFLNEYPLSRVHFFPTGSLHELMAVVKSATLVITPDTSVVHIASAFKRPTVALYPLRHEWPPYKTPYRLLIPKREQPVSHIPMDDIVKAVKDLISSSKSR